MEEFRLRPCLYRSTWPGGRLRRVFSMDQGAVITGKHCASFQERPGALRQTKSHAAYADRHGASSNDADRTMTSHKYIFATEFPPSACCIRSQSFLLPPGVGCCASGFRGDLLRPHPLYHYSDPAPERGFSQHLAAGKLGARARALAMESTSGRSCRRLQQDGGPDRAISSPGQRQLVCDINHELRSPLARLKTRCWTLRAKGGAEMRPSIIWSRILSALMGRHIPTVARLDASSTSIEFSCVESDRSRVGSCSATQIFKTREA